MDSEDKRKYILDNISFIENHNKIINFIHFYEIKHTENNNGYFLNISILDDSLIEKFYKLIFDLKNNKEQENIYIKEKNINFQQEKINKIVKKNYNFKDININDFNNTEKKLITISKNYKFE